MLTEYISIGQVLKPQGLKGEVKVRPDTNSPDRFLELNKVYALENDVYVMHDIHDVKVRNDVVFLKFDDDNTCEDAEKRRDLMLFVDRKNALQLEEDEYFICDIEGCEAYDDEGAYLGIVTQVMQPGANDVYVISHQKKEILVPVVEGVALSTDVLNKKIVFSKKRLSEVAVF